MMLNKDLAAVVEDYLKGRSTDLENAKLAVAMLLANRMWELERALRETTFVRRSRRRRDAPSD